MRHCASTASRRAHALTVAAVLILVIALSGGPAAASAASPTVSGPVTGGAGVPQPPNLNGFDLAQVGYQQSEYFLSGTASASVRYASCPMRDQRVVLDCRIDGKRR